jgi:hypothetical protein
MPTLSKKLCVFCQRSGVTMSQEHVFSKWLNHIFTGGPEPCRFRKFFIPQDGKIGILESRDWTAGPDDTMLTFGRVCKECNEGWLSRLETEAAPVLKPLIAGDRQVVLSVPDQLVILRWTMKTGLMFDILRPAAFPPFFTANDRLSMTKDEFAFVPVVFLAPLFGSKSGLGSYFIQLIYGAHRGEDGTPDFDEIEFHLTLNLGRLAIQLICLLPNPRGGLVRMRPMSPFWREIVVDITRPSKNVPRPSGEVLWPPTGHLNDKTFALFRDRWTAQYIAEGHLSKLQAVKDTINQG